MMDRMRIGRRLVLRRMAGGGAVLWTAFGAGLAGVGVNAGTARARSAFDNGSRTRRPQLVILDPGHGGRDPGARGIRGTAEKDVALASALSLQAALRTTGRYRVELTRTTDRYVALEDRVS